jgi:nitroreductase
VDFLETLRDRRSIRHYNDQEVSDEVLLNILEHASWAPSPGNTQPWRIVVLSHYDSKQFIEKFELKGWEFTLPVLREAFKQSADNLPDLNKRVVDEFYTHAKTKGSPRVLLICREKNTRRYIGLFKSFLSMLYFRAKTMKNAANLSMIKYFATALTYVPTLFKVDANTRLIALANFSYATALTAYNAGLASCIQSSYLNMCKEIKRDLKLDKNLEIALTMLIGYKDEHDPTQLPKTFATRKPVNIQWINTDPLLQGREVEDRAESR